MSIAGIIADTHRSCKPKRQQRVHSFMPAVDCANGVCGVGGWNGTRAKVDWSG
ncbi:MAG: hypothetical protein ACRCUC_09715 [Aestuariivirga sp.]